MRSDPRIKVLMFGWEFPPYVTGGLGTHCWNLTKSLSSLDTKIFFVTPHPISKDTHNFIDIVSLNISQRFKGKGKILSYGKFYENKIRLYNRYSKDILDKYDFDIIHCQDRMPIKAAIAAKKISKKPLVLTVHSTEFDKTDRPRKKWIEIEKKGMQSADRIIAVSNYTKGIIVKKYGIDPKKIVAIPNGVESKKTPSKKKLGKTRNIFYLGRIAYQKGLPYLIEAAAKVLKKEKNVKFLIAGAGKEKYKKKLEKKIEELGLTKDVVFLGYVKDRNYYYKKAYLFVMPSVSEPFGITPLEAISNGTPAIISKQSGIAEVLNNCIKVDYFDTEKMAKSILMLIKDKKRYEKLRKDSIREINNFFSWDYVAKQTVDVYKSLSKN